MANIIERLRDRVARVEEGLQSGDTARAVLEPREDTIMSYQYQQLFDGKQSNGEDIRPYYSEDMQPRGYFATRAQAEAYIAWKRDGIPYPFRANRNPDAPNLYINGKFHGELGVFFNADDIVVKGKTPYASMIVGKYGLNTFGLNILNWDAIFDQDGAYKDVMDIIKKTIWPS